MYTRDYQESDSVQVPSGYRGTLLDDVGSRETEADSRAKDSGDTIPVGASPGILSKGLRGLLGGGLFHGFKIGTEELLIIAAALFLFLSKEGDKECAILLVLLLFVS